MKTRSTLATPPGNPLQDPSGAAQPGPLKKSARFVSVTSKLPMGLMLQLDREETRMMPGRYGPQEEKTFIPYGPSYFIRGTSYPNGQVPKGYPKRPEEIGAAVVTRRIPADFWEAWYEQKGKHMDCCVNGLLVAHTDIDTLVGVEAENAGIQSGFDPCVYEGNDPRAPKPFNHNVGNIERELRAGDAA